MSRSSLLVGAFLLVLPGRSQAHVKWFCAYDTTIPPLPIKQVLTPAFAAIAILFCALMFVAYVADRALNTSSWSKRIDDRMFRSVADTNSIIRVAVGILFLLLWDSGGTILTPELKTTSSLVPWVQIAIAASMMFHSTTKFGAVGIMALYLYAVEEYGAFHMMDYPVFPAIAVYLALTGVESPYLRALQLPVLYAGIAATMMWGAIEKFGYPYWTFPLLATHQGLTLGFSFDHFMCLAGFVEFSLAFFMVTGTALLRCACIALMALILGAVPEFGKTDAVGHLLIVAGLAAMIIADSGPSRCRIGLRTPAF